MSQYRGNVSRLDYIVVLETLVITYKRSYVIDSQSAIYSYSIVLRDKQIVSKLESQFNFEVHLAVSQILSTCAPIRHARKSEWLKHELSRLSCSLFLSVCGKRTYIVSVAVAYPVVS